MQTIWMSRYSELDGARYEVRKVEVFNGGKFGYASKSKQSGETRLGITPVPSNAEIMVQPEFDLKSISKSDFEAVWSKATTK